MKNVKFSLNAIYLTWEKVTRNDNMFIKTNIGVFTDSKIKISPELFVLESKFKKVYVSLSMLHA